MSFNTTQLESLIRAGANITISGNTYNSTQLEGLARAASKAEVTMTLTNMGGFNTTQLESIVRAGAGRVHLVL